MKAAPPKVPGGGVMFGLGRNKQVQRCNEINFDVATAFNLAMHTSNSASAAMSFLASGWSEQNP